MKPAVGYLRRSTTKQEQSLDGQRHAIEAFASRQDLRILRWYVDDGISGSTGEARPEFLRMVSDAQERGDFQAVVAYDLSRFGRMDGDETGHYRYLLRRANVEILYSNETVAFDDETSEIVRPILQSQKREYLKQLSRDTLRGQVQAAKAGWASGRAAAFGFDRVLIDEAGAVRQRLKRGEKYSKPRSWHVSLAPSDTPGEVETLQWMFKTYHECEVGCRELAKRLNDRGLPSPQGGRWVMSSVRAILKNPVYKGDLIFGRRGMGKFHRLRNGEVRKAGNGEGQCVVRPVEEWVVHRKPELALVAEEVWNAVNQKLMGRGERCCGARARKVSYPLTGVLRCAHCGASMFGVRRMGIRVYYCSTYQKGKGCACNSVREDNLLAVLRDIIQEHLFVGGNWEALKAAVLKKAKNRPEAKVQDSAKLSRQLEQAKAQHARAAQNLLLADPANVPALNSAMNALRDRMKHLESELAATREAMSPSALAEAVVAKSRVLFDDLMAAPTERLKAVLGELVEGIHLKFEKGTWGKRQVRLVTACDVHLKFPVSINRGHRGDWRSFEPITLAVVNEVRAGESLYLQSAIRLAG